MSLIKFIKEQLATNEGKDYKEVVKEKIQNENNQIQAQIEDLEGLINNYEKKELVLKREQVLAKLESLDFKSLALDTNNKEAVLGMCMSNPKFMTLVTGVLTNLQVANMQIPQKESVQKDHAAELENTMNKHKLQLSQLKEINDFFSPSEQLKTILKREATKLEKSKLAAFIESGEEK